MHTSHLLQPWHDSLPALAQVGGNAAAGVASVRRDATEEPPGDGEAEAIAAVSARQAVAARDLLSLDLRLPQA